MSRRLTPITVAALVFSLAYARLAHAQDDQDPPVAAEPWQEPTAAPLPAAPAEGPRESYSAEVMAADGLGWAMLIAAAATEGSGTNFLVAGGLLTLAFGGPMVHAHNGNNSGAGKSLATRLLLPIGGAAIGVVALSGDGCGDCNGPDFSGLIGGLAGFVLGMVTSEIIDWAVFAQVDSGGPAKDAPPGPYRGLMMMYVPSGAGVGLGGTF